MIAVKRCIRCGEEKPLDDFYSHPRMKDGRLNVCKECKKADSAAYAKTDAGRASQRKRNAVGKRREYLKANLKRWRRGNPEKVAEQQRRYPERRSARQKVKRAVASGRLVRGTCEVCGATYVEAHHDDYSKPLDVRWLCKLHHEIEHGRIEEQQQ